MSEETKSQGTATAEETKKINYWDSLNQQFLKMQSNIDSELATMQQALAERSKNMTAKLEDLSKINDMFHGNLNKQLDFQERLDKILEESHKRQIEQQVKFQEMIDKSKGGVKKKEPEITQAPTQTDDYQINL